MIWARPVRRSTINKRTIHLEYTDAGGFSSITDCESDDKEATQIEGIAPYFTYIGETLNGRTPIELYEARKDALRITLRDLRDNNGLLLGAPVSELTPH